MSATPAPKTQLRFALLFFAVLGQLILLGLVLPATRSFAVALAGTILNAVLGMLAYLWIGQKRSLLRGAVVYFLFAVLLCAIEMIVLSRGPRDAHIAMIPTGVFYPLIIPVMLGIIQRRGQPTKTQTESGEREKLRNRNGF